MGNREAGLVVDVGGRSGAPGVWDLYGSVVVLLGLGAAVWIETMEEALKVVNQLPAIPVCRS